MNRLFLLFLLLWSNAVLSNNNPKNIIMIIADGMGPNFAPAYRYYKNGKSHIEPTVFDKYFVGSSSTYPHHTEDLVTDSAASATALASGIKTYNGAIGVDINQKPVLTVLEYAKTIGKKTGIVVTSEVNHATPASYLSHIKSRQLKNEIADSYFDDKIDEKFKFDVLFGGGQQFFQRDDRNLINEFIQSGFQYIEQYTQLDSLQKNKPVIGLFAYLGLPSHIDDKNKNRLTTMSAAAIQQLKALSVDNKGYFLLIESSQIDWAAHDNDIAVAMHEVAELEHTLLYLEEYIKSDPDTLVILTADHNTGGFSIAKAKEYIWKPEVIKKVKASALQISKQYFEQPLGIDYLNEQLGFLVTEGEYQTLNKIKQRFISLIGNSDKSLDNNNFIELEAKKLMEQMLRKMIDERSHSGWTTTGHTATDVPVYALGHPSKHVFSGFQDNTDIAKKIFTLLGKKQ